MTADPRLRLREIFFMLIRAGAAWQIGDETLCDRSLEAARRDLERLMRARRTEKKQAA